MGSGYNVFVEGNIGAGKSTILDQLSICRPAWLINPEPIQMWTNWKGENLLEHFYESPHEYGAKFQFAVLESFLLRTPQPSSSDGVYIWERSPRSATKVFLKQCQRAGYISVEEHGRLYDFEQQRMGWFRALPSMSIYLRVAPERCYERLNARA